MHIHQELLKFLKEDSGETRRVVNTAKTGPGRPDRYQLLAEEDENAWYVSTTQKAAKEKTIIFSDPFLTFRQPSSYELELWQKLLSQHTVFLWQGRHIPLQELNALSDEKSFLNDAPTMPFETKEQIIISLQRQGCKTDNFIVIDALQYYQFLGEFLFRNTYSSGIYHALSWNDSVICGIAMRLLPAKFHRVQKDEEPILPKILEKQLVLLSSEIAEKIDHGDNSATIYCESQFQLEQKLHELSPNTSLEVKKLNLISADNITQQTEFVIPRLTVKEIVITANGHHWDLAEIEGCESVSVTALDNASEDIVVIFPPLAKAICIEETSIEILQNLPASTQELSLIFTQASNIQRIVAILEKLPALEKLSLFFSEYLDEIDLSSLKLQKLTLLTESTLKIKGIPLSLRLLALAAKHISLVQLNHHTSLKAACIWGAIDYIEHLPSSIEHLLLSTIVNSSDSNFKIDLNVLNQLRYLNVYDCNATTEIKGLSSTLLSLHIVKCKALTNLDLKGLTQLERLDLLCLGDRLKIDSDRDLQTIKYYHHLPQQIESRYLPQLDEKTKSLTLKGVIAPNVSGFPVEHIVIKNSMLMCETFYPATIKKLEVMDSVAWKNVLDLSRFVQLEELVLTNVKYLKDIRNLPKSLRVLIIDDCSQLKCVDFEGIEHLDEFGLSGIPSEWKMLNSGKLKRVGDFTIVKYELNTILDVSGLDECRLFTLKNSNNKEIKFPKKCELIHVENCHNIESLDFSKIQGLKSIKVERCYGLASIHGVPKDLRSLEFSYNPNLSHSLDFSVMHLLKNVRLYHNRDDLFYQIAGLLKARIVEQFESVFRENEQRLANKLDEGYVVDEKSLYALLNKSDHITTLKLARLSLKGRMIFPELVKFRQLQTLTLQETILNSFAQLPESLIELELIETHFISADIFRYLKDLRAVKIRSCSLPPALNFSSLHQLQTLEIVSCEGIDDAFNLYPYKQIKDIQLLFNKGLKRIEGIPSHIRNFSCGGSDLLCLSLKGVRYIDFLGISRWNSVEFQIVDCEDDLEIRTVYLVGCELPKSKSFEEFLSRYPEDTLTKSSHVNSLSEEKSRREQEEFGQFTHDVLSKNPQYRQNNPTDESKAPVFLQMNTVVVPDSRTAGFSTRVMGNGQGTSQDCAVIVYDKGGQIVPAYYRFNAFNTAKCNLTERSLVFCYRHREIKKISLMNFPSLHPLQNNTLETLEIFCNKSPDWGMCSSELELSAGDEFPLISTPNTGHPHEFVIYSNDAADLDLIIDYTEQRICVALNPGIQSKTIKIAHRFKIQENYILRNMVEIPELLISREPLLDEDLRNEITKLLASKPEFEILLDTNVSLKDKLSYLYDLCLNFDLEKDSINASSHNSLDIIFDIIRNRKGVCRHRAEVFMLLAHYLDFPVTMYNNQKHQYIDMPIIVDGKVVRQGFCLGGGLVLELRSTNPFKQTLAAKIVLPKKFKTREQQEEEAVVNAKELEANAQEVAKARAVAEAKTQEESKVRAAAEAKAEKEAKARAVAEAKAEEEAKARAVAEAKVKEEAKARAEAKGKEDDDDEEAKAAAEAKEKTEAEPAIKRERAAELFPSPPILDSISFLFSENAPHAPLLQLPANQDPIKVAAKIRLEFQAMSQNLWPQQTLYIHDLSDFKRLARPVQIAEGNRRIISGPLMRFLEKGGLVIINWSQFTDTQKKRYMALLEPEGTLFAGTVSPYLKIISLIQDSTPSNSDAFLSRMTPFRLSQSFKSHIPPKQKANPKAEFVEAELYYLHNWRERLLGMPAKDQHGYHFRKQGKLLAALAQKKNLSAYNLPKSASLEVFLHRLRIEYEIFHNANFITVPDDFLIETQERPFNSKHDNITLQTKPDHLSKPGHFCNANTLHECFQPQVVDSRKDNTQIIRGFFAIDNQFYITEAITRYEWQELLDKSKKYPQRQFTFTFLPGGEIQGIAKYTGEHNVKADQSQVVFSNDTDFCALRLKARYYPEALIVDASPQLTYQQLIALLDDKRDLTGQATFTYQQHAVLSALIQGDTIILNGEISYLLYQQLLPYLYPQLSRIHQNGDEIKISGRLVCVMPQELQDEFLHQSIQVQDYQPDDYLVHIPPSSREKAVKIISLFKNASKLSHLDLSQPPVPQLTFRRLTSMLARLNNHKLREIHPENPLKGLLHYDYPIHSTNYAFLNVVAKFYFSPAQSRKSIRWIKCRQFIADNKIQNWQDANQHIWKLMNFCSGQMLRELFETSLMDNIDIINGRPLLKSEIIGKKLFCILTTQHIEEKSIPLDNIQHKPITQLETLIAAGGTRVIFFKGPSGGGKSFALSALRSKLPQNHYFKGRHQYTRYLSAKPEKEDKPVVLNLEEINTEEPGALDKFKGMLRDPSLVHLNGEFFRPSSQHIIVGSGNQETYLNRSFHKFLQENAETIHFKLPNDQWLVTTIIMPILDDINMNQADLDWIANQLLSAFHNINTDSHCEMSLRDLRSLAQRFIAIYNQKSDLQQALSDAIWYEFGYKNQAQPIRSTENPMLVFRVGHLFIPETKYFWVEIINQDLNISAKAAADRHSFRRGILFEGPSGVGKSSLYKVILEQRGYRKDHPEPKHCYYEISIDDSESTLRKILEAAILGCKLIADEIDPCVEELLNECLEGQLPDHPKYQALIQQIGGDDAKVHPDFFVLASRNPGVSTSAALLNRFHYVITQTYTRLEYLAILIEARIPNPEEILNKFFAAQQKNPRYYNARKFFEWLSKQINQNPLETHDVKQWCLTLFTDDNNKKHSFASFKRLLDNPEQQETYRSILDEAVQQGNLSLLLQLIENQMPLLFTDPISLVFSALKVEKNSPGITETLLAHSNVDWIRLRFQNGNTILHCCLTKGLYSLLAYLLRHIKTNNHLEFLNIINDDGLTALALACAKHDLRSLHLFQMRSFFEMPIVSHYVNSVIDGKSLMWQLITARLVTDNHFLTTLIRVLNVDYRDDEGRSYLELLCQQTLFPEKAITLLLNKHPHLIATLSQNCLYRCLKDPDSTLAKDILFLSTQLPNVVLNESLQRCDAIKKAVLLCCKPWNFTKLLNLPEKNKYEDDFQRLLEILSEENTCIQYPRTERQRQSLKALAEFEYQDDSLITRKNDIINQLLAYQSSPNINIQRVDSLLMAIVCAESLHEVNQCILQQVQIHQGINIPFEGLVENYPEHLKPMPLWRFKDRFWGVLKKLEQPEPSNEISNAFFF